MYTALSIIPLKNMRYTWPLGPMARGDTLHSYYAVKKIKLRSPNKFGEAAGLASDERLIGASMETLREVYTCQHSHISTCKGRK